MEETHTMDDSSLWMIALVVGSIFALIFALNLAVLIVMGAVSLFVFAATQGFVGLVAYVAAWVFLFPVMLGASLLVGFLSWRADAREHRAALREESSLAQRFGVLIPGSTYLRKRSPRGTRPPSHPAERHKWANRLPPYDD